MKKLLVISSLLILAGSAGFAAIQASSAPSFARAKTIEPEAVLDRSPSAT